MREYFISNNGSDTGKGTVDSPFLTFRRAQREVLLSDEEATVWFRSGTYYDRIDVSEELTAKVTYSSYPGERAIFTASLPITKERIRKVTDKAVLSRIIDENVREHLYEIDLSDRKSDLYPIKPSLDKIYFQTSLFRNGEIMEFSRFPKRSDNRHVWEKYTHTVKCEYVGEGAKSRSYIYLEDDVCRRMEKWDKNVANDLWLCGYLKHNWRDETHRVLEIDPKNNRIVADAHKFAYGLICGEEIKQRLFLFNILDELSDEREFFIDYGKGIVYVISYDEIKDGEIVLGYGASTLLNINKVRNVTVKNIDFSNTHALLADVSSSEDIIIEGCTFAHGSDKAITVNSSKNVLIKSCDIFDFCYGGIEMKECGKSYTMEHSQNVIENCIIHDVARTTMCYTPAISIRHVCGAKISHCTLYNSPHNLIHSAMTQDMIIEYCELYAGACDSDDASVIYWGRDPGQLGCVIRNNYIHDCRYDKATWGVATIYQDDNGTGADIYNNIFYNDASPDNSAIIKGTQFHNAHNNIFIGKNPPDGGAMFGYSEVVLGYIGAYYYPPKDYKIPKRYFDFYSMTLDWHKKLEEYGFFTNTWKEHYKNTFWETMYDIISEEKRNKVVEYAKSIENEEFELKRAKLIYFTLNLYWSHKLAGDITYDGSLLDCMKECFKDRYEAAYQEVKDKGEAAYYDRMNLLSRELYWDRLMTPLYSSYFTGNLMVGVKEEFFDNGEFIGARTFNNYPAALFMNNENNFAIGDDTVNGKSIFKSFGSDFSLTDEGLKYVQEHIKGFEGFDTKEIGAKR